MFQPILHQSIYESHLHVNRKWNPKITPSPENLKHYIYGCDVTDSNYCKGLFYYVLFHKTHFPGSEVQKYFKSFT